MHDALSPSSLCAHRLVGGAAWPALASAAGVGRAVVMALGTVVLAGALTACGGGAESGGSGTEHQTTESHVTAGDESANSGGHGEDPNASHDPAGADGVHDEAAPQPHPDESTPPASS